MMTDWGIHLLGYIYSVTVLATRPATDYTATMIPNYDSVAILWKLLKYCGSGDPICRRKYDEKSDKN